MIERLLMQNLRRAQAFDRNLSDAAGIYTIADKFIDSVIYEPDAIKRSIAIQKMVTELTAHVKTEVLPQGESIGTRNAASVLGKIPSPVEPLSQRERQIAKITGEATQRTRGQIVEFATKDAANTLENRLVRFWLEPAEGGVKEKINTLKELETRMEDRRAGFETRLREFTEGKRADRPTEPDLDLMPELKLKVKKEVRVQARRTGTDAEIQTFRAAGHGVFAWVAVNGVDACPDCLFRAGVVLPIAQWEVHGRPGSGQTICGIHCFCMLVPEETLLRAPSLGSGRFGKPGPLTPADRAAFFNAHRFS
jgi:hypothetical protein